MNISVALVGDKVGGYKFSMGSGSAAAIIVECIRESTTKAGSLTKNIRDAVASYQAFTDDDKKAAKKALTAIFDEAVAQMKKSDEGDLTVKVNNGAERLVVSNALNRHRIMEAAGKVLTGVRTDKKYNAPHEVYGKQKEAVADRVSVLNQARIEERRELLKSGSIELDGTKYKLVKSE